MPPLVLPSIPQVEAELCRRSLRDFLRLAWPQMDPADYIHGWHIDAIADHLEAVSAGEILRLLINIPPRHAKSSLVAVAWPVWEWITRPETRFLYASYAQGLSYRDSRKRRALATSAWFTRRWPDAFTLEGQVAVERVENDHGGYWIATSVGGQATGEGGSVLVVDDPTAAQEAASDAQRATANAWWDQTMSTRLDDPKTGRKVIIMQRQHEDDLSGHVLTQGGYEHLCLPARYEPRHPYAWRGDPRQNAGDALWEDRFGDAELAGLEAELGSYAAAGQLQQRPSPAEGGIVQRAWWGRFDPADLVEQHADGSWWPRPGVRFDASCLSWDMAFKATTDTDYVVGEVWARRGPNAYLLDVVRARWSFTETLRAFEELAAAWPWVSAKLVEEKANGAAVLDTLKTRVAGLIPVNPKESKEARVHAVSPFIEAGNVFVPHDHAQRWVDGFVEEWAVFPNGANDDQVDAGSQALDRLLLHARKPARLSVPRGRLPSRIPGGASGRIGA